jgi:hypothetical protein
MLDPAEEIEVLHERSLDRRSIRRKPWRGGFQHHTVVGDREDRKSYEALERKIIATIAPASAIELELSFRLASLFWRLRRMGQLEKDLFSVCHEKICLFRGSVSVADIAERSVRDILKTDLTLLDRAGAYEMRLWRQTCQLMVLLEMLRRPLPSARTRHRYPRFPQLMTERP